MKIIVLSDNRHGTPDFEIEHGLSVYVETDCCRYLFDTGASPLLIRNAHKAGVDLSLVDVVIISHGHSDHTGGLEAFFRINSIAKVYVAVGALNHPLYSRRNGFREIGSVLDMKKYNERLVIIDKTTVVNAETVVFRVADTPFPLPLANDTLYMGDSNHLKPDDFSHELVAVVGKQQAFVFTGCGHKGLLNILQAFRLNQQAHQGIDTTITSPAVVFGGFHLVEKTVGQSFEDEQALDMLADRLCEEYPATVFYTGHCTGDTACRHLSKRLSSQLKVFGAGNEYII